MSDEDDKKLPTPAEAGGVFLRSIFKRDAVVYAGAILVGLAVCVSAVVLAQGQNDAHIDKKIDTASVPMKVQLADHERRMVAQEVYQKVQDDRAEVMKAKLDDVQQRTLEMQLNVRILVEKQGLQPVKLTTGDKDGGL
jgi:hypothetical protein